MRINEQQDIHHTQMVDNVRSLYDILFQLIASVAHEQVVQSAKNAINEVYPPEPNPTALLKYLHRLSSVLFPTLALSFLPL